jgi:hypothetical protein
MSSKEFSSNFRSLQSLRRLSGRRNGGKGGGGGGGGRNGRARGWGAWTGGAHSGGGGGCGGAISGGGGGVSKTGSVSGLTQSESLFPFKTMSSKVFSPYFSTHLMREKTSSPSQGRRHTCGRHSESVLRTKSVRKADEKREYFTQDLEKNQRKSDSFRHLISK